MIKHTTIEKTFGSNSLETNKFVTGIHLPYQVDDAYFDGFPQKMLEIVFSSENSKHPNFSIPENYFSGLADNILNRIKEDNLKKDLEGESPLNKVSKVHLYNLPEGYFENLSLSIGEDLEEETIIKESDKSEGAKIVSIDRYKKWMNIAVAASLLGIVITSAILFSTKSNSSERYLSYKSVDVKGSVKKLSDDELVKYLNTDVEAASVDMTITDDGAEPDVDQRIKSVSDFDLDSYLQESATSNVKKGI